MEQKSGITITVRDRLLRAWEDAMAQVKAFELWSSEIEDEEVAAVFAEYAEDEGLHAARLLEMLKEREEYREERTERAPSVLRLANKRCGTF